jgi:hypothetical protein
MFILHLLKNIVCRLVLTFMLTTAFGETCFADTPQPPTNLQVKTIDKTAITIVWTASPSRNITQYLIFRDGTKIASVSGATLSYTDNDLKRGKKYTYSIKAKNSSEQLSLIGY